MAGGERLRLTLHAAERADPEPKALACYGLWLPELPAGERMPPRFVDGRPVSAVTRAFLAWATERPAAAGVRALVLIWGNASWHISREVRTWLRQHNRRVKAEGGCRLLVGRLPSKSPWLNPIEMLWRHYRREVTHCELFATIDALLEATATFFARYNRTPERVRSIIGAIPRDFCRCT